MENDGMRKNRNFRKRSSYDEVEDGEEKELRERMKNSVKRK